MADRRHDRGPGPRGNRRPAGPRAARPRTPANGRPAQPARTKARPRLTGRAAALLVVLAVLAVSYASSMRAWMQQREHIADLRAEIERTEATIGQLEREKRRLDDPAYVQQQARERFNYVLPGEKSYRVLDENGKPLDLNDSLDEPLAFEEPLDDPWWSAAWESVLLAGNPPSDDDPQGPADKLEAPSSD